MSSRLRSSALVFALVLAGCASKPNVDAFVTRIAPEPSTLLEQRTRLDLRLQNLGDKTLDVRGVSVRLDLNGARFAQGVSDRSFELPALSEATTSVTLSTSTFDLIRQLLRLEGRQAFAYELKGTVHSGNFGAYRFRRTGEFSRAQLEALGRPRD